MSIADFFFGRKQNSTNSRRSSQFDCLAVRARTLSVEPLETRDLLSITTGPISDSDYSALRAQYPDFNLPEEQSDLNVVTVDCDLSDLKSAISAAGTTEKPDLILVKTTDSVNSIVYSGSGNQITINVDSTQYGSVTIIGWGTKELTLNANEKCRVMSIVGNTDAYLGNLTITRGKVSFSSSVEKLSVYGGGIYSTSSGVLTLNKCTISNNAVSSDIVNDSNSSASSYGGGIFSSSNSSLILTNCNLTGNSVSSSTSYYQSASSSYGGGVYSASSGILAFTNCTISNNTVYSIAPQSNSESYGGGIYSISAETLTLTNCTISNNNVSATYSIYINYSLNAYGGGIFSCSTATLTLTSCIVSNNKVYAAYSSSAYSSSYSYGGGIYSYSTGVLAFTDCTISSNSLDGKTNIGAGVYMENSTTSLSIVDSSITSTVNAQSIFMTSGNALIKNSTLTYACITISGGNSWSVLNSSITGISSEKGISISAGGGLDTNLNITNSLITNCQYGLFIKTPIAVTIVNSTITNNSYGINIWFSSPVINIYNSIVAKNSLYDINKNDSSSSKINAFNTLSSYTSWSNNEDNETNYKYNSSQDLFDSNYKLVRNSQAINKGNNSYAIDSSGEPLTTDLAGIPRILGSTIDLGAYEFDSRSTLPTPEYSVIVDGTFAMVNILPVENATEYRIEYSLDADFMGCSFLHTQAEDVILDLQESQTYYIRIKSIGNVDYYNSGYSSIQTVITNYTLSAQDDFVNTMLNCPITIDCFANDNLTGWLITDVQFGEAVHGEYVVRDDGTIVYTPESGYFGIDNISYSLVSQSGSQTMGMIVINVDLPITTSVQLTSANHTPETEMTSSVERLTDWDNCCIELWVQGVSKLNSGETIVTLEYNPAIYEVPYFSACAEGVALAVSESVFLPNGNAEIQLTVHVLETIESQTDNLFLGTVVLMPSLEEDAGVEDVLTLEPVCVLNGSELTTTVGAMPYDLIRNGTVDVEDFIAFATVFGFSPSNLSPDNPVYAHAVMSDFNNDNIINVEDFIMFATNFGMTKKRVEIPIAQASVTTVLEDSGEIQQSQNKVVFYEPIYEEQIQEPLPVVATSNVPLILPETKSEASMTLLEAHSTALLDLYDNQESSEQIEINNTLAKTRIGKPFVNYADSSSRKMLDNAIDLVLEEDLLAIEWK